ncbi:MAG TPA: DUF4082 domain-containing protein [Longimicrobium sp.]|nr:DUF4082 domain-containing protein [Longimicrobium sp.]
MKRLIFATAAALALSACSDTSPVMDTRTPPANPNRTIFYGPVQTIFTSETPASTIDATGGWEVSTRFTVYVDGKISGFRFWKASGETGTHTARLWTTSGTQLASATFSGESSSGWQSVSANKVISAGDYIVSVNTNEKQVKTFAFFGSISHDDLYADYSYYGQPTGSFPTSGSGSAYFVDVNFRPYVCNTLVDNPCP